MDKKLLNQLKDFTPASNQFVKFLSTHESIQRIRSIICAMFRLSAIVNFGN